MNILMILLLFKGLKSNIKLPIHSDLNFNNKFIHTLLMTSVMMFKLLQLPRRVYNLLLSFLQSLSLFLSLSHTHTHTKIIKETLHSLKLLGTGKKLESYTS